MSATVVKSMQTTDQARLVPNYFIRLILTVVGSSLAVAAFGLWLVPGSDNSPELSLIKLGASLLMLVGGLCCMLCSRAAADVDFRT